MGVRNGLESTSCLTNMDAWALSPRDSDSSLAAGPEICFLYKLPGNPEVGGPGAPLEGNPTENHIGYWA